MSNFDITNKFWEIVSENSLRDILIPVAADDGRLKRVTRWMLSDDQYPDASEEYDYEHVVDLVMAKYGLMPNQKEEMLNLCENNICNELNHGN